MVEETDDFVERLNEDKSRFNNLFKSMSEKQTYIMTLRAEYLKADRVKKESLATSIIARCDDLKTVYDDMIDRILNNEFLQLHFSLNVKLDKEATDDDKVFNSVFTKFTSLHKNLNKINMPKF
jgi:hypothetical protein